MTTRTEWQWFAITPGRGDLAELQQRIPELAARGVARLLLREKQADPATRTALARQLIPRCRQAGLECWLAEDADLAAELGADGVHLSERSAAPSAIRRRHPALALGLSLHQPLRRTAAEIALCQHVFLSPLFATPHKGEPLGLATYQRLATTLPATVYALGGIGAAQLPSLRRAGIRHVAGIRLFFPAAERATEGER